jgi:hypothetical protein
MNGGDRISYTYDEIDESTEEVISQNNKGSFYALDPTLKTHINAIREYIQANKLQ